MTGLPSVGHGNVEVLLDVAFEIELALLDELHHRRVRHELRDRARAKQRALRIDRPLARDVRVAVALLRNDLAALTTTTTPPAMSPLPIA